MSADNDNTTNSNSASYLIFTCPSILTDESLVDTTEFKIGEQILTLNGD